MIRYEVGDDHVGRITLDRPEAKNALTVEMRDDLVAARAGGPGRRRGAVPAGHRDRRLLLRRDGPPGLHREPGRRGRLRPPDHQRGAAGRGADLHPGAVGAGQADGGRRQRHRGGARRPSGPGLRLRARPADHRGSSGRSPAGAWWSTPAAPTCCPAWSACPGPRPWSCSARRWSGTRRSPPASPTAASARSRSWPPRPTPWPSGWPTGPTRSLGLSKQLLNTTLRDRPWPGRWTARATPRRWPPVAGDGRGHGRLQGEAGAEVRRPRRLSQPSTWRTALAGRTVLWVGVRCDARIARRESLRDDRVPGLAASQADAVHAGCGTTSRWTPDADHRRRPG